MAEFLHSPEAWNSTVFESTPLNFPGCIDATYLVQNMRDFAMRYADAAVNESPPGIIVLDFPLEYEFTTSTVATIERLSDVGQPLNHGKFKGAETALNSHVVVFANVMPPSGLLRRCIWLLRVNDLESQPQWEYPGASVVAAAEAQAAVQRSAAVPLPEDIAVAPVAPPAAGMCTIM